MNDKIDINNRTSFLNLTPPKKSFITKTKLMLAVLSASVTFPFKRIIRGSARKSWGFSWELFIQTQKAVWNKLSEIGTIEFRHAVDALASLPLPKGIFREVENMNGVRVERFTASNTNQNIVIYFHGGGYIFGSSPIMANLISGIANSTQSELFAVDYRLAPENPWPAAIDDGYSVYQDLLHNGKNPQNIIFLGDSAGGNLCLMLLLKIKSQNMPYPAGAVTISPWVDLSNTGESFKRNAPYDYVTKAACEIASTQFVNGNDPKSPMISPLYSDVSGLPNLLIQAGECEVLIDQITEFAKKTKEAGVDIKYSVFKDMIHDWHIFPDITKNAEIAFKEIGKFIDEVTCT